MYPFPIALRADIEGFPGLKILLNRNPTELCVLPAAERPADVPARDPPLRRRGERAALRAALRRHLGRRPREQRLGRPPPREGRTLHNGDPEALQLHRFVLVTGQFRYLRNRDSGSLTFLFSERIDYFFKRSHFQQESVL